MLTRSSRSSSPGTYFTFHRSGHTRSSARRRTLWSLLGEMYPVQKLRVIKSYRAVPRKIANIIGAISELRNRAAHEFGLGFSHRATLEYKRASMFAPEGFHRLGEDVYLIEQFFVPWLARI